MLDRQREDKARRQLEDGPGGDKDVPYRFEMPFDWRVVDCWMRLVARWAWGEFTQDTIEEGHKDEDRS